MASNRKATVELSIEGADQSKAEIDKVRLEVESIGDAGKSAAQKFVDSMSANDTAYRKFETAVEQGSPRQERIWAQLKLLTENYRQQLIATWGTAEAAPPAAAAALQKYETRLESATLTVRRNKDALSEMKTELGEGGEKWTNLGDAVNKSLGPLGAVQAKIGLVAAAFSEGWQIGQKMNTLFGTDMSEWDEASGRLGAKIGSVLKAISDNIVALVNVALSFSSGSITEIKRSIVDLKDTVFNSMNVGVDAVSLWGNEWDKAHPKVKKATDAVDAHTAAADKNTTALKANSDEVRKATTADELFEEAKKLTEARLKTLATETDKLTKKIGEEVEAKKKEEDAYNKANNALMDAEIGLINRTSDMSYFGRVVDESTKALEKQNEAVAESTAKYGANDPFTLKAIERQKELENSLAGSKSQYDKAKDDVAEYSKQQDQASAAVERAKDNLAKLDSQLTASKTQLANLDVPLGNVADNVKKVADHADKAATGTGALANAQAQAGPPVMTLSQTLPKVADSTEKLTGLNAALTGKTALTTVEIMKLDTSLVQLISTMTAAQSTAEGLTAAINRMGSAAAAAAGAEVQPGNV